MNRRGSIVVYTLCGLAAAVAVGAGVVTIQQIITAANGPVVLIEAADVSGADMGRLPVGTVAQREVTLTNRWMTPVRLEVVYVNCACMRPTLSKLELSPGETATLRMEGTVAAEIGTQHFVARIRAADLTRQRRSQDIDVEAYYTAATDYTLVPEQLAIIRTRGDATPISVYLQPEAVERVRVERTESTFGDLVDIMFEEVRSGNGWGTRVDIVPRFEQPGVYEGVVRLRTDSDAQPVRGVRIAVRIEAPSDVASRTMVLRQPNPGEVARVGAPIFGPMSGEEPADEVPVPERVRFDPAIEGLSAEVVMIDGVWWVQFEAESAVFAAPTGVTTGVLVDREVRELRRYHVVWIGPLERLHVAGQPE